MKSKIDSGGANTLLILLVSADALLIVLNILYLCSDHIGFFRTQWLSFSDRCFAESYTYIKEFWIVLLLAVLSIRKSKSLYFAWSLLYGYLLVDDSFRLHERLGSLLAFRFDLGSFFSLSPQGVGELFVYIAYAILLVIPIVIVYFRSDIEAKMDSRCFFFILALLALFGVGFDTVHEMITNITLHESIGVLENGGEMLVVSIMLWFVFCLFTNSRCRLDICSSLDKRPSCWLMRCVRRFACERRCRKPGA